MKKSFVLLLLLLILMQTITGFSFETLTGETHENTTDLNNDFLKKINWQGEYDVIVVGYGGAGATASIEAADQGAKVLLIEKAPKGEEGGNTRFALQAVLSIDKEKVDKGTEYFQNLRGKYNTPSDDIIKAYLETASGNYDWLKYLGAENIYVFPSREYDLPGGEVMDAMLIDGEIWTSAFYRTLQKAVEKRKDSIEVWYESPGVGLIQDPETKIIHGVVVDNNGTLLNVRAKNGVVLCTGGFENNMQMIQDYLQLPYAYSKAARYNTGDGIKMAMEAGANLWHMSNIAGPDLNVLNPETNTAFAYAIQGREAADLCSGFATQNVIFVGADGTRFTDESFLPNHGHVNFHGTWKQMPLSLPAFAIFDETARLSQSVYPTWSEGNVEEIEKGLIVKADTIKELAEKIGVDTANLQKQIREYNRYCLNKNDPIFGRAKDTLKSIKKAPYYAMELVPSFTNTQGGPERNENGEVLDLRGNSIPHLYSAGELGSVFSGIYQGSGNLGECIIFGRISGKSAATVKNDITQESVMEGKTPVKPVWQEFEEIIPQSGEFIGEDRGIGGPIKVLVTMKDDKIFGIEVVYHNETRGVSTNAIDTIITSIIKNQTTDVDAVSGATVTSRALMNAVKNALENKE
ncbi:MAG: FAD-binding protein [Tissierellia bacterium]|jgi:succinate dehydrogenase/fumarate reductase flavoprotein subunit|nr:FAD-binding protein [Tissierellia bacterium]MDD3225973.1 FAD-binding protein [Tissierellia bacterium]MDD3750818.1 FAD-binding protein [Tissierellia bacterium]MDD4046132.1 FAD-binding protein [Tissierellia bacterium]MDD4677587.1 FAD-binding protein [Tissierellia bacterium]